MFVQNRVDEIRQLENVSLVLFPLKIILQILQLEDLQFQKFNSQSYGGMVHPGCNLLKRIGQAGIYLRFHEMILINCSSGKE